MLSAEFLSPEGRLRELKLVPSPRARRSGSGLSKGSAGSAVHGGLREAAGLAPTGEPVSKSKTSEACCLCAR